jgi:hypothetical protein
MNIKSIRILPAVALLSLSAGAFAQTFPEPPVIYRQLTSAHYSKPAQPSGPNNPLYPTTPHVPSFRTTRDGRLGMKLVPAGGITLLMPEKLNNYVYLSTNSTYSNDFSYSYVMSHSGFAYMTSNSNGTATSENDQLFKPDGRSCSLTHMVIYDPTGTGTSVNPHSDASNNDVYDIFVVAGVNYYSNDPIAPNHNGFTVTPVEVTVSHPKTTDAKIISFVRTGPVAANAFTSVWPGGSIHEQMVCGDGRLIVFRFGPCTYTWTNNSTTPPRTNTGNYQLSYSYYPSGAPCNPTKWTTVYPISHAPYDPQINHLFKFAMQPFRDPANNPIPDGLDIGGTYPWIDRDARNIFFTANHGALRYGSGSSNYWTNSRYPCSSVDGMSSLTEGNDGTRGICVAGLWTHGKVVMIDTLNNDMDYEAGSGGDCREQSVTFYTNTESNPLPYMTPTVNIGGGRVDYINGEPAGDNQNSTIIESLENIFNYNRYASPLRINDVVWPLHNAKHSDDLVFDDYVDPDVFINADMNGLTAFTINYTPRGNPLSGNSYNYYDGWNNSNHSFDQPVLLQNAACAPTNRWTIPTYGSVVGGGRLEPIAMGGIHGKGFWLTGSNSLQFTIPTQTGSETFAGHNWYVGLFVDCRFSDDTKPRTLLNFPDGSKICLAGLSQVQYYSGSTLVKTISLTNNSHIATLYSEGWNHLAWQIKNGGTNIDFLLDGLVYDTYTSNNPLFQLSNGTLTVGYNTSVSGNGFRGWIDDFKVIAHTVDPETACNEAGGTLVGLPSGYTDYLTNFVACYPSNTMTAISNLLLNSGQTAYPTYANYINYSADYMAPPSATPSTTNMVSVRDAIRFPEGPLFWNAPRPDSSKNQTCLTCHSSQGLGGLTLTALSNNVTTEDQDTRRQPFQPYPFVSGNIPPGLVTFTGLPSSGTNTGSNSVPVDDWLLPTFSNVVVNSFTLVDASNTNNMVDLTPLTNNQVVMTNSYPGVTNFAIRANLSSEQGNVTLKFNRGSSITPTANPYLIYLPRLPIGANKISATPTVGVGSNVTISFTVK